MNGRNVCHFSGKNFKSQFPFPLCTGGCLDHNITYVNYYSFFTPLFSLTPPPFIFSEVTDFISLSASNFWFCGTYYINVNYFINFCSDFSISIKIFFFDLCIIQKNNFLIWTNGKFLVISLLLFPLIVLWSGNINYVCIIPIFCYFWYLLYGSVYVFRNAPFCV